MARTLLQRARDQAAEDRAACRQMRPSATDAEVYAFAAERMADRAASSRAHAGRVAMEYADDSAGRRRLVRIYRNEAKRCEQVAAEMAQLAQDLRELKASATMREDAR